MAAENFAIPLAQVAPASSATHPTHPTHARVAAIGAQPAKAAGVFVPLSMLALAVVVWLGFQCVQLALEHRQIGAAQAIIDPQEQTAIKIRSSLDGVATATAKLAAEGNPTARAIVEELRKRGVTINAQSAQGASNPK
jgi:hypothetical protein